MNRVKRFKKLSTRRGSPPNSSDSSRFHRVSNILPICYYNVRRYSMMIAWQELPGLEFGHFQGRRRQSRGRRRQSLALKGPKRIAQAFRPGLPGKNRQERMKEESIPIGTVEADRTTLNRPAGTAPSPFYYPGNSCQATITESLRDIANPLIARLSVNF
jgi:hypothetical protein